MIHNLSSQSYFDTCQSSAHIYLDLCLNENEIKKRDTLSLFAKVD